jgi:hypothetical protein
MGSSTILRDYFASAVRTVVGYAIATALTYIARHTGIIIDEHTSAGLVQGFTFIVGALYYIVVRGAEVKFPKLGWLLGLAKLPTYASPANTVPVVPSGTVPVKE